MHRRSAALLLVASLCAPACILRAERPDDTPGPSTDAGGMAAIPALGEARTLDIASWNLEWFGARNFGPTNEVVQLQNVRDVVAATDFDIWGLAEVVDGEQWQKLADQLPGYTGLLANDPSVVGGAAYYSDFDNTEQKVAILYKSSLASVLDARVILTDNDYDFAGRAPLQVTLRVTLNGATDDIVVIVMHPKCCSDTPSWQRRVNASIALKSYLDATFPTQKVWVIGDFNDDVDTSIASGQPSPYANFIDDPAHYTLPTQALSLARIGSTVRYSDTIDHHLNTTASNAIYLADSAAVDRVDRYIPGYGTTTSDHYPVLSRYTWPAP
jgi:endonuclease/exonuclease/phosphatase family metal-dependent hydrolase